MGYRCTSLALGLLLAASGMACAADAPAERPKWDMQRLEQAPKTWPAAEFLATLPDFPLPGENPENAFSGEGVQALFYEGLPWRGKATRVFAWYGLPERKENEKVPAMVLVHGGGGTAFDEWVRIWNKRGYAAIAMDVTGSRPGGKPGERPAHEWGGPPHKQDFEQAHLPFEEQWPYHAVADVILAHSLLRSFPEIDAGRIGLTGISWGGYLTCMTAALDHRFQFAVPVYGCGFLNESPAFAGAKAAAPEWVQQWFDRWDASHWIPQIACPTLWINGANDTFFPLNIYRKSYLLCGGMRRLSVQVGLNHSHVWGWEPKEIYAFVDSFTKGAAPLARVTDQGTDNTGAWAAFDAAAPPQRAELVYSTDVQDWVKCVWNMAPAEIDAVAGKVHATLPEGCKAYFFRLIDARDLTVTSVVETP